MTSREFGERLSERAGLAGVSVEEPVRQQLEEYFRLLAHWNSRINLTALPVDSPTDEVFDRLLVEPIVAATHIPDSAEIWLDLGSGGGSPAVPLKILRPSLLLTMVEARGRKAAFLREAVRTLRLGDTNVENARFEELASRPRFQHRASLVTVRAVKPDAELFAAAHALLAAQGRLLMFRSNRLEDAPAEGFRAGHTICLMERSRSYLVSMGTTFHVEQTD